MSPTAQSIKQKKSRPNCLLLQEDLDVVLEVDLLDALGQARNQRLEIGQQQAARREESGKRRHTMQMELAADNKSTRDNTPTSNRH